LNQLLAVILTATAAIAKTLNIRTNRVEQVKHELDVFQSLRKTDCISIAGGEPLLYPNIVELVAEVKSRGLKTSY